MTVTILAKVGTGANGGGDFRTRIIEEYLPLAEHLARRYAGRGEPLADLNQVAVIGLMVAADRFDAERGVPFASFAIPTILGELKRHFRDTTWPIRVTRSMQNLALQVTAAAEHMTRTLQRSPTTAEIAAHLGMTCDDVHAARCCGNAYRTRSLDQPFSDATHMCLGGLVGAPERGYAAVEARVTVRGLVAALPERDRRLLHLRYVNGWSQSMIAAELGVSQMQVSRLLAHIIGRLRRSVMGARDGRNGPEEKHDERERTDAHHTTHVSRGDVSRDVAGRRPGRLR